MAIKTNLIIPSVLCSLLSFNVLADEIDAANISALLGANPSATDLMESDNDDGLIFNSEDSISKARETVKLQEQSRLLDLQIQIKEKQIAYEALQKQSDESATQELEDALSEAQNQVEALLIQNEELQDQLILAQSQVNQLNQNLQSQSQNSNSSFFLTRISGFGNNVKATFAVNDLIFVKTINEKIFDNLQIIEIREASVLLQDVVNNQPPFEIFITRQ
ncbi:hypothetical protein AB4254_11215 [Vibrio breoganii]